MTQPGRPALPQAFFLPDAHGGQRLCLFHPPQGDTHRGRVLYLHPFAEELNTTRRVVAQQARALSQAGFAVLQIDLLGCGDSSGDFADASWEAWLEDAQRGLGWLNAHATGPLWLWGMRSGALLASEIASSLNEPAHLLLWQPVTSGEQMLQQFLRLHAAGQWLGTGSAGAQSPAQMLAKGHAVHIAGYTLSPRLAEDLRQARLQPPDGGSGGRLVWLELTPNAAAALSPAATRQIDVWRSAGWQVQANAVTGPLFWHSVSTDDAPVLLHATVSAITSAPQTTGQAPEEFQR